jgi:aldose sugar dehydrogenase
MEPEQPTLITPDKQPEQPEPQAPTRPSVKKKILLTVVMMAGLLFAVAGGILWWQSGKNTVTAPSSASTGSDNNANRSTETPELTTETVLDGRSRVWDIAFLPTEEMLFSERAGTLSVYESGKVQVLADIEDVVAGGEGGLLGIAVDPKFSDNRYIYTCFNTAKDIRIVRWTVNASVSALEQRKDIVTGAPRNSSGRHSGCRVQFGLDGYLWIGTGDTAQDMTPQTPQAPKSLGGKILRVDRDGKGAPGNLNGEFDDRVYSYGHRNTQGLAFFGRVVEGVSGISVEHGTSVDDEVNLLERGNFGWAPPDGPYDEGVPMTDKDRFPDAVEAIWSSGNPTQAPSGAAVLIGSQWKAWDGAVVVAMLKAQHLKVLLLDKDLKVADEIKRFEDEFGRLRSATLAPDGSLYLSTDNGTNDKIIRVTPK